MTTKSTKAAPAAETVDETAAAATEPATAGTAADATDGAGTGAQPSVTVSPDVVRAVLETALATGLVAAPAPVTEGKTNALADTAAGAITAQKVEYEPTTWADGSVGGTPITAAKLNRMETGIGSLATQNNALVDNVTSLQDSLSRYVTLLPGTEITSATVAAVPVFPIQIITSLTDGSTWQLVASKDSIFLYEGDTVISTWDKSR